MSRSRSFGVRPLGTTAGTALSPNVVDAKGDLIAGTAADTVARLAVGANDTLLTADSGQATGVRWTASPVLSGLTVGSRPVYGVRSLPSGRWRITGGAAYTSGTCNIGVERAQLVRLPPGTTLQAVAVNVTTAGGAGTVVRIGARSEDPATGQPGASSLLADWGTVDAASTGIKSLAVSFVVPVERLWLTVTAQVGTAPVLAGRGVVNDDIDTATSTDVLTTSASAGMVFQTGVTGALPSGFTFGGVSSTSTAVAVQAA